MTTLIVIMIVLMLFSAFFSSSETTLFSLTRPTLTRWKEGGTRMQKVAASLMDDHHSTLTAILLGNNFVNLFSAIILLNIIAKSPFLSGSVEHIAEVLRLSHETAEEIVSIILNTCILLVFGELTPKSIAFSMPRKLAPKVAGPILFLRTIFYYPLIQPLKFASSLILRLISGNKKSHAITAEEYVTFTQLAYQMGVFEKSEIELFEKVFSLREVRVSQVMTPRPDIITIDAGSSLNVIQDKATSSLHTMLPIVEEDLDHVIGILDVKAFIMTPEPERANWRETCLLKPLYLPGNSKADQALEQFREHKRHMALVVNEFGGIEGILTSEDILEEIVGEIYDEFDQPHWEISEIRPNEWRVVGPAPLSVLSKEIGIDFGDSDADTVAGYMAHKLDHLPKKGEVLIDGHWRFRAKRFRRHRLTELEIRKLDDNEEASTE